MVARYDDDVTLRFGARPAAPDGYLRHAGVVATEEELEASGFHACRVSAKTLNIDHSGSTMGPFCRLVVDDSAPTAPGVYAWACDGNVMYVGKADVLRQIVHGARMNRAYNDYTYIPASKVRQVSSPRVRVNGLLNRALCEGSTVRWWWREADSSMEAARLEATLIDLWNPPWNRSRPLLR